MNYNKIKEEIKRRNFNENFFIPENSKLGVQGFNKAIKKKTLKVEDLISISNGLKVPVSFWFQEEDKMILAETEKTYGDNLAVIIKELRGMLNDSLDDKRRMKEEIDDLRQKLGETTVNRKATG